MGKTVQVQHSLHRQTFSGNHNTATIYSTSIALACATSETQDAREAFYPHTTNAYHAHDTDEDIKGHSTNENTPLKTTTNQKKTRARNPSVNGRTASYAKNNNCVHKFGTKEAVISNSAAVYTEHPVLLHNFWRFNRNFIKHQLYERKGHEQELQQ